MGLHGIGHVGTLATSFIVPQVCGLLSMVVPSIPVFAQFTSSLGSWGACCAAGPWE